MRNTIPSGGESDTIPDVSPHDGPGPHEDLTIGEHIETMLRRSEHRPGQQCFVNEHGEKRWVAESEVTHFIRKYGAEHPSNYALIHGSDWLEDFFGASESPPKPN